MKTIIKERKALLEQLTEDLCAFFAAKPSAVFTMASGRTMLPVWSMMAEAAAEGRLQLSGTSFFQTAEFRDCPQEKSLRAQAEEEFVQKTDLRPEACFWLDGKSPEVCDEAIRGAGGLDLAILGIGDNAQIGFNEPATPFYSHCRLQKLTDRTKIQYAWRFGSPQNVPDYGITMGIRTLTAARKIIIVCLGHEKADATFRMLYARDDSVVPAAFLQLPSDVTVYADLEAGEKL